MTTSRKVAVGSLVAAAAIAATVVVVRDEPVTLESLDARVAVLEKLHGIPTDPPPTTDPPASQVLVFEEDTTLENETVVLRPGDTLELRNGARLNFGEGATLIAEGTPPAPLGLPDDTAMGGGTWLLDYTLTPDGHIDTYTTEIVAERDIRIFGQGDIRFIEGSLPATIRYVAVELTPVVETGHYPLHWHHVGDGSRGTLVEGVIVSGSTNRAYVPHASHGITFRDTIAVDTDQVPYWWDLPTDNNHTANNSNDIVWDASFCDGVNDVSGDSRRNACFMLGAGFNNTLTNSVGLNVEGTVQTAGAVWPVQAAGNPGGNVWTFTGFFAAGSANCTASWQNGAPVPFQPHLQTDTLCMDPTRVGAYGYNNEWVNLVGPEIQIWSRNTVIRDSNLGVIQVEKPGLPGGSSVILIENTQIGLLRIVQFNTPFDRFHTIVVNNSGIGCDDVEVAAAAPQTTLTIDGVQCVLGQESG